MTVDWAVLEVKRIVGNAVAVAYGYRRTDDGDACPGCGGDGCERCGGTGEPADD